MNDQQHATIEGQLQAILENPSDSETVVQQLRQWIGAPTVDTKVLDSAYIGKPPPTLARVEGSIVDSLVAHGWGPLTADHTANTTTGGKTR